MDFEEFFVRHGYVAIFIALLLEEMGIPMPLPTDVLVIIVGYQLRAGTMNPVLTFLLMQIAANIGASVLYLVVRQGGRPLVDRFGRYVHLKPEYLARSEDWIRRMGWWGIAIGRAIPGVRYATVISCGLFRVPYWRFLTAQMVGTSLNMLVFLALGWIFGPAVIEYLHLPQAWLRPLILLAIAIVLPILIFWMYRRTGGWVLAVDSPRPWRRHGLAADGLVGFVGAIEVTCIWSAMTILTAELSGAPQRSAGAAISLWLQGRGLDPLVAYGLIYLLLTLLCIGISVLFHELPLERRIPHVGRVAVLAVAGQLLIGLLLALALVAPPPPLLHWWRDNWQVTLLSVGMGLVGYAVIAVYGRILAVRALVTPPWGRSNGHTPAATAVDLPEREQSETLSR